MNLVGAVDVLDCAGNYDPEGIWSDGTTVWVADRDDDRIYAYSLRDNLRDPSKEFNGLNAAFNHDARGIWSDGSTMWVADSGRDWVYGYNMSEDPLFTPAPAVLGVPSRLTVEPANRHGVVRLNWRPAENANVQRIYLANADSSESRYWGFDLCGDDDTAQIAVGHRDQEYRFSIIAGLRGIDGTVEWSDWSEWSDPIPGDGFSPVVVPALGTPAGLTAVPGAQSGEVVLRWAPAANATFHWVYLSKVDGTDARYWETAIAGDVGEATVTGLEVGQTYQFWVQAGRKQADGTTEYSEWSDAAEAVAGGASTAMPSEGDSIVLFGGMLNGNRIVASSPVLSVAPGQAISGTVDLSVTNHHGGHAIFPVGATINWGSHRESFWSLPIRPPAFGTSRKEVNISVTAPQQPGTYAIIFAAQAETSLAHVMSGTHWPSGSPRWDNGDDVAGWSASQIDFAIANGYVLAPQHGWGEPTARFGAAAVKIIVSGEATSSGPLGNPTNLTAAPGDQSGEVDLRWTPAANATAHWVYLARVGGGDSRYWENAFAGDANTATITGLEPGKTYRFWVQAGQERSDGTTQGSEWSNAVDAVASSGGATGQGGMSISSGADYSCALQTDGSVVCWGRDDNGQASPPAGETFTAITNGVTHGCGLRANGSVACWGNDDYGQATPPARETFTSISAGNRHVCGLRADGTPVCWGKNTDRTGRFVGQSEPPSGETFVAISAGGDHTCALRTNGTVRCWGSNLFGERTPPAGTALSSLSDDSFFHACGLDAGGTAICWGISFFGVTRPPAGERFSAIGAGDRHTCGLRSVGSVICWGSASDGRGRFQGKLTPPAGQTFTAISVGWNHTCGLTTEGTVACWGDDSFGQSSPPADVGSAGVAPAAPDLVVRAPSVSESTVEPGDRFTFSATVYNQGSGRSARTTLRYYRSTDSTIDTGDTEQSSDGVIGLDPNEEDDESQGQVAPSDAGTYYYGACVDPVEGESDTGNNCSASVAVVVTAAVTQGSPDLTVYSSSVFDKVYDPGERFDMSFDIRNRGTGASTATASVKYYRSSDNIISPSDTELTPSSRLTGVGPIAAGGRTLVTVRLEAQSSGVYYYGACVGTVPNEANTGNNCGAVFRVTLAAPDLVVRSPSVSESSVEAGERFTFRAEVYNQGSGTAESTTLRYYRSSDATVDTNDIQVDIDRVSSLDPAEDGNESENLTAPSGAGTYYYGACVDAVRGESNTANNCSSSVRVTVTGNEQRAPDLTADRPTFSDYNPERGTSIMLTVRARNEGDDTAPATTLRVYRSIYSDLRHEVEVEDFAIPSLRASRSYRNTLLNYNAANWVSTFYYRACVDAVSGEANTQNNCSEVSVLTTRERDP